MILRVAELPTFIKTQVAERTPTIYCCCKKVRDQGKCFISVENGRRTRVRHALQPFTHYLIYFILFEAVARANQWPKEDKTLSLTLSLNGRTRAVTESISL